MVSISEKSTRRRSQLGPLTGGVVEEEDRDCRGDEGVMSEGRILDPKRCMKKRPLEAFLCKTI